MQQLFTIKINFKGGLISPGDLLQILQVAKKAGISYVSFGLRQQLLVEVDADNFHEFIASLKLLEIDYEVNADIYPNIVSSYPAEEVFITKTWLSEGVYKDIFDSFEYNPVLKINISDNDQSFTPLLTGNVNWVASNRQHFWYLVIRFPKTNVIYYWRDLIYTNDIAAVSKKIETVIRNTKEIFYDNKHADGDRLYELVVQDEQYITARPDAALQLPPFSLPYYEGFNKFHDKYWLGIYRRDELFPIHFLQDVCTLCLQTKIGQICSTPWKSIIIKGIEEKDRNLWNEVLGKHQVNVRHAANELNFQVEDNCKEGLAIKNYLVKHLNNDDSRTFGICFGIKTRKKSEVFSNILVRRKSLFTIAGIGFFNLYDVLFAEAFNPNERTGKVFSRNNIKLLLPEQIRLAIVSFYNHKTQQSRKKSVVGVEAPTKAETIKDVHQCKACLTVYDDALGYAANDIAPGTAFEHLPGDYRCPTCEGEKEDFEKIPMQQLLAIS
jgi:rubredoxin